MLRKLASGLILNLPSFECAGKARICAEGSRGKSQTRNENHEHSSVRPGLCNMQYGYMQYGFYPAPLIDMCSILCNKHSRGCNTHTQMYTNYD